MLKMVYGEGTADSYDFTDDIKVENRMQLTITTGSSGSILFFFLSLQSYLNKVQT